MAKNTQKPHMEEGEQLSESYISIGLGLLVVVVVGILLYNYFTQRGQTDEEPQPSASETTEATTSARPGSTYTVAEGDTLWTISEKSYGTGYNWEDIMRENDLNNPDDIEVGQTLKIPEVSPAIALSTAEPIASPESAMEETDPKETPEAVASAVASSSPIATVAPSPSASASPSTTPTPAPTLTGNSYTVAAGDSLWTIAERAYGDPYKWTQLAEANKLVNPNLIHPGNELTVPR